MKLPVWETRFYNHKCGLCEEPIHAGEKCVYIDTVICHVECAVNSGEDVEQ